MPKTTKTALRTLAAFACIVSTALPLTASARSQSTLLGRPNDGSLESCFDWNGRGVANVCGSSRWWMMPIVYDNSGNKEFAVGVRSSGSGTLSCRAGSHDRFGDSLRLGAFNGRTGTGYVRSTVNTHGYGAAWMQCLMPSGSSISTLHY